MPIRLARHDDLKRLQAIEVAAGAAFTSVGMPEIAAAEPPPFDELRRHLVEARIWVATDQQDEPIAYLVVELLDGAAHIEQVSVHPAFGHRRIGRGLVDHVDQWARVRRLPALTLTTFRAVPWNAPYYERCGFRVMDETGIGPELRARRDAESEHGLDPKDRVCMVRDVV